MNTDAKIENLLCALVCYFVPLCETYSRELHLTWLVITIREPQTLTQLITTSMFELFRKNNAAFSRGLGLLLVLLVFYGTTIEAAHRHGRIPSASNHTASVERDSSSGISTTKPGCHDCLICQLHQNSAATLISFKPIAEQITRITHARRSEPISISSLAASPSPGRAPPQAN